MRSDLGYYLEEIHSKRRKRKKVFEKENSFAGRWKILEYNEMKELATEDVQRNLGSESLGEDNEQKRSFTSARWTKHSDSDTAEPSQCGGGTRLIVKTV